MAIIFDATLTQAQLAALVASHYYWISKRGDGSASVLDVGGAALVATATVPAPPDQAVIDVSQNNAAELFVTHGALTSAVGGKVSVADVSPDGSLGLSAGTVQVFGATTTDQVLAATAESLITSVVNTPTTLRRKRIAVAILFTTVPTAGTGLRIMIVGHEDGQVRRRG